MRNPDTPITCETEKQLARYWLKINRLLLKKTTEEIADLERRIAIYDEEKK